MNYKMCLNFKHVRDMFKIYSCYTWHNTNLTYFLPLHVYVTFIHVYIRILYIFIQYFIRVIRHTFFYTCLSVYYIYTFSVSLVFIQILYLSSVTFFLIHIYPCLIYVSCHMFLCMFICVISMLYNIY